MRRKLGRDLENFKLQLEVAKSKFKMMSSALRTSAHAKRREREEDHENIKGLQQNTAQKGERTGYLLGKITKPANDIKSQV